MSKTNNLRDYTLMMKSVLNPDEIELSDISIIERFEELFERTVKVIDDTD